ncbi:MAG: YbbR-like domain-containing protein [Nitrospiraceae bacterium]|nr:MAG: YbbR-like domain-containing protein [Nitrospiraceae bacterium]
MIKDFFTSNIWLKLASLIMAIILWFFVILSGRSERTIDIPVNFVNLPPKLEVVDSPQTVRITIEGRESILKDLKAGSVHALIDLSEVKTGKSFITITRDNIELTKMLAIKNIDPETVSLMIEDQLSKQVNVIPDIVGTPEKGYAIVEVISSPKSIIIEGPKSLVRKIRRVKTEPIDINDINADLTYRANLVLANGNIRKSLNKVEVNISVKKITAEDNK